MPENKITNPDDYSGYLYQNDQTEIASDLVDIDFWKRKLEKSPNQFPYVLKLASKYNSLFDRTSNIDYLSLAEEKYIKANEMTDYKNPSYLHALARNYIKQHKFREAYDVLLQAEAIGDKLKTTELMMFDVLMELGQYEKAKDYLNRQTNHKDFDFLVRFAKWKDYKGDLDAAINSMEQAMEIAERSNLPGLKGWIYTNLADYYGHAGRLEDSYSHYLKSLALGENEAYALKGIAWIAYSYENDAKEALKILEGIPIEGFTPDMFLLMAEIAEFDMRTDLYQKAMGMYMNEVKKPGYGAMYAKYNVLIGCDDDRMKEQALQEAAMEVERRPSVESYDLLAWALFKSGRTDQALEIVEEHLYQKTFEPEVLYHMAEIFKANELEDRIPDLKKELEASIYELGPTMKPAIERL